MKTVYQIFVNGIPKAQPRPRLTGNGRVFNPHTADAWKAEIKSAFMSCRQPTITEPVKLRVVFVLPIPKNMKQDRATYQAHTCKPDVDNLLKAAMDAMTMAKVWTDDAIVYHTDASKFYGEPTGAQITIEI